MKIFTAPQHTRSILPLTSPDKIIAALRGVNVKHTVVVAQGGEDALAALAALSAQCSKVGSNLNQLTRHFNSGGKDTEQLRAKKAGNAFSHVVGFFDFVKEVSVDCCHFNVFPESI